MRFGLAGVGARADRASATGADVSVVSADEASTTGPALGELSNSAAGGSSCPVTVETSTTVTGVKVSGGTGVPLEPDVVTIWTIGVFGTGSLAAEPDSSLPSEVPSAGIGSVETGVDVGSPDVVPVDVVSSDDSLEAGLVPVFVWEPAVTLDPDVVVLATEAEVGSLLGAEPEALGDVGPEPLVPPVLAADDSLGGETSFDEDAEPCESDDEPEEDGDPGVSAQACGQPCPVRIAVPIPRAAAKPPIRPM